MLSPINCFFRLPGLSGPHVHMLFGFILSLMGGEGGGVVSSAHRVLRHASGQFTNARTRPYRHNKASPPNLQCPVYAHTS